MIIAKLHAVKLICIISFIFNLMCF